ncbi:MAG TPA: type VI secretion system protein, partial [Rhodocyclaceae bacterium]|nr:type VI secretion system protein [Rhodocyclaceae bacterium]
SEGAQWRQTLAELNALRPERPLDGLVLCISARSLLQADAAGRETLAMNLQRQLGELQESMEFMLPLSVVVTQCDAIDGFAAFWGNQAQKRRLELFGYAAPPQTQAAAPAEWTRAAFDTIDERLRSLQVETAASRDSIADCDAFFLFPGRFRRLCDPLGIFLETALRSSAWQAGYLFRGLFFAGSPSADGELHEGARQDVAFADSLLAMRVLAEPGLARPTRNGIFSRNTLIRGLQYASLGLAAGLFGMLYFSSLRVSAQVHVLISAMDQLRESTPDAVRHGDCLGAESVYPLLSEVAAINQNTRYWAIPASWLDTRIVHRNDAGIETGTIGTVLMPTLACRLENKARTLASASYALPDADDGSAFATLRQALVDKLAAVRELEENLARFERLANNGADLERPELLSTLTALAQYAFDAPLPPDVQHEHGALSAAFGNVPPALKPVLPPHLHQDLAFEIRRLAEATRISLHQQVGLGAVLLGRLDRAEAPVLDNTRRFADWLSWTDTSWLLSTPAVNPCAELHTATKTEIEALVDRYAYPKALWRDVAQFDT